MQISTGSRPDVRQDVPAGLLTELEKQPIRVRRATVAPAAGQAIQGAEELDVTD